MPLHIQLASGDLSAAAADVLVTFVTEGELEKQPSLRALDKALGGALLRYAEMAEFSGKHEQHLELSTLGRIKAHRLLIVGLGKAAELSLARQRAAIAAATRACQGLHAKTLALKPPRDLDLRVVGEGIALGAYRFDKYLTGERKTKRALTKAVVLLESGRPSAAQRKALELGHKIGEAVAVARDAVNEPPNELTPAALADVARRVARQHHLAIRVLDKRGIAAAGMKLHYAVGQGSANEPRFVHMTYKPPRRSKRRLVFVGKGLTFDSGGLCIKPAAGMGEMKSDMGGAAAVLGLMAAIALVRPNIEVHGILGIAENMPDGTAYRPGDVFGSLSGRTVEIVNTDAEGRLVLADALTYAKRLKPDAIIDAATLTGAALIALGKTCTAYYSTDEALADSMKKASEHSGEGFWRMPLIDELGEQLKSDVADLKHTGDRWGGSITAALFLREFVGEVPWIHCDIAGPAFADRARGLHPKGGTGHPVLTFLSLVEAFH